MRSQVPYISHAIKPSQSRRASSGCPDAVYRARRRQLGEVTAATACGKKSHRENFYCFFPTPPPPFLTLPIRLSSRSLCRVAAYLGIHYSDAFSTYISWFTSVYRPPALDWTPNSHGSSVTRQLNSNHHNSKLSLAFLSWVIRFQPPAARRAYLHRVAVLFTLLVSCIHNYCRRFLPSRQLPLRLSIWPFQQPFNPQHAVPPPAAGPADAHW